MSNHLCYSFNLPLYAKRNFISKLHDCRGYDTCEIQIKADTDCRFEYSTSNNKIMFDNEKYDYKAGDEVNLTYPITKRYVYVLLRNVSCNDQSSLKFRTRFVKSIDRASPTVNEDYLVKMDSQTPSTYHLCSSHDE